LSGQWAVREAAAREAEPRRAAGKRAAAFTGRGRGGELVLRQHGGGAQAWDASGGGGMAGMRERERGVRGGTTRAC
jgi:hypothetical protein